MSRLDELINELCPDGVEFVPVGSFAKEERGKNKDLHCNLAYSITTKGLMPTAEFYNKGRKITSDDVSGYKIVRRDWFVYSPSRIDVGSINFLSRADEVIVSPLDVVFSIDTDRIQPKFLLYYLRSWDGAWQILSNLKGIAGTGRKMLPFRKFATFEVPLPPLPIQSEIVRILDKFTEAKTELTSLLSAELTARRKQYEYYRDKLLTFGDGVEYRKLGEVCFMLVGGDKPKVVSKERTKDFNIPIISNGVGKNCVQGFTDKLKVTGPAVTIAGRGVNVGHAEYRNYPYYPIIRLLSVIPKIKDELDTKFLYYSLQDKKYHIPTTGIPQLTVPMVQGVEIPVPPLATQQKIVSILDRFDSLCNDITAGLPAEIASREKQYSFYRDRLLSFKRRAK